MDILKQFWSERLRTYLDQMARTRGIDAAGVKEVSLILQRPPKPELGDLAVPMFPFAKMFRAAPPLLAAEIAEFAGEDAEAASWGTAQADGPYVNIRVNLARVTESLFADIRSREGSYGSSESLAGNRVMIEFSCPNTNKPLHLGHLRNDSIGASVARILKANGAEVRKVNLINDRGVHICKSMLAYLKFGQGRSPESEGVKSDHFVGDYYVKFSQWARENPAAEQEVQEMLRNWEQGDEATVELWKLMNHWAIEGIESTYDKTDIFFDQVYYESSTYAKGREEVLKGLQSGIFHRDDEGTVWVDLEHIKLGKKVLLRKDGTSLYVTQDIGTAVQRYEDWPFDRLIYVVGSEQQYHFTVLFHILSQLGYSWADQLYHLSYGMVNLPEGKMKSREGTVVDADDLIDELERMAKQEIVEKGREHEVDDLDNTAEAVALGALNYYLLQVTPAKDMVFNPKESLSFTGNTGPYLQYMGARISSMLRKYEAEGLSGPAADGSLLTLQVERELIKMLAGYPDAVVQAGAELNPSVIAAYLYDLTRVFSRFYHDVPVLRAETPQLASSRIELCRAMRSVLMHACRLLGIPFLEVM